MIEEVVPSALAGERLDRIVALMADISRSDATATITGGGVLVDGDLARSGKERMAEGRSIVIDESKIPVPSLPVADPTVSFEVVFEDADLIVVDKPSGLVVHPAAGHSEGTLVNGLLARFPELAVVGEPHRPGIVHRLDVGTSGLLLVAHNDDSYRHLVGMLANHEVVRRYTALVWGAPESEEFTVDAPIGRDPRDPLRMAIVTSGKEARTHMQVLRRFRNPDMALVRCDLETGRTHQIRVHARAIGHPVVGDASYGGARSGIDIRRPFLHASELEFEHPRTGELLRFESPLPRDLLQFLDGLENLC